MNKLKYYRCKHCGNLIEVMNQGKGTLVCCGDEMELLEANTSDGATEKHVPVECIYSELMEVKIGSIPHPSLAEHHIEFITLVSDKGIQMKYLDPLQEAKTSFALNGEHPLSVFEFCNLHGLWEKEIQETSDGCICSAEFSEGCI